MALTSVVRRGAVAISLLLLIGAWIAPAIHLPGQTLSGADLVQLGLASGAQRLLDADTLASRVHGALALLAIAGNVLIPVFCFGTTRRATSLVVSAIVLVASLYMTWRLAGQSGLHLRLGIGLWYMAMLGFVGSRWCDSHHQA